jgi:hypothetical protein
VLIMKMTPQVIVGAVLAAVLAVCCLVTHFGGWRQREIGYAYRQARMALAGQDAGLIFGGAEAPVPDNAIEPLEQMVEICPDEFPLQMTLVGLYLRPKSPKLDKARALCEKIASDRNPDKSLRALALVHIGMIEGAEATAPKANPEARPAKLAATRKRFEEAVALDEKLGDAYAGLGLLALWEGHPDEAGKQFAEALKPGRQMGIEVSPEVFNGLGLVAAAKGNLSEARAQFEAAERTKKELAKATKSSGDWKVPAANRRAIEEGTVGAANMDPAMRKKLLAALEEKVKTLKGPAKGSLLNPIACGRFYAEDFAAAAAHLEEAAKLEPQRVDVCNNLMATRCALFGKARQALEEALKKAADKPPDSKEAKAVDKAQAELVAAEGGLDRLAVEYLAKVVPPPDLEVSLVLTRIEMRLRAAAAEKVKAKADKPLAEADKLLADALGKFPDEPRLVRLAGIRDLAEGRVKEGLERFGKSLAKDAAQPDLRAIVEDFSKPLEIVGFRPASVGGKAGPILASSSKPLLGVLFRTNTGPIPLAAEKVRLLLDGAPQSGIFWGTEYLSMPEAELPDGEHVLAAEGEDAMGHKARGEVRFLVDASPPQVVSTEPTDGGTVRGRRPKLAVTCKDKYSGVDPTSVEIEVRSRPGAETLLTDFPVRGGRYTYSCEALGMKKGEMAGEDKFVFTTTRDIGLGSYTATISVGDQRGVKTSKTWTFTVVE